MLLSVYYVDCVNGNDSYSGLAGAYTSGITGPWKTIAKVNSSASVMKAGDSVLFQRGDVWREQLITANGSAAGRITYGAYGDPTLPMPSLMGSTEEDSTADWTNIGGNVWTTTSPLNSVTASGSNLLPNPSFASGTSNWASYINGSYASGTASRVTPGEDSNACYRINCTTNSSSSPDSFSIQLYTYNVSITAGNYYLLTFYAKASASFTLPAIMVESNSTYQYYGPVCANTLSITTAWTQYKVLFKAWSTASDTRITSPLGAELCRPAKTSPSTT